MQHAKAVKTSEEKVARERRLGWLWLGLSFLAFSVTLGVVESIGIDQIAAIAIAGAVMLIVMAIGGVLTS